MSSLRAQDGKARSVRVLRVVWPRRDPRASCRPAPRGTAPALLPRSDGGLARAGVGPAGGGGPLPPPRRRPPTEGGARGRAVGQGRPEAARRADREPVPPRPLRAGRRGGRLPGPRLVG